ncbi:MmgE/PrpD family protein [Lignipirellula cremea]|uniref:2-methylcitrate dehydratase n=1 Tax=Lignipirellula cremea TaxID=2528010 RepID=A0A518DZQ9_9BACT|nr:MmgE/PrpD family protein [Lignipirellula cremea]QDU97324.1 2-methylcitrate dehydratase [Lignipirellula cremea]
MPDPVFLSRDQNQARGIARYTLDFLNDRLGEPDDAVYAKVEQFHLDSVACAVAALAAGMNAPVVLRQEALSYPVSDPSQGAALLGSTSLVAPEKAVVANSAAARELDANGTNFGYNPRTGDAAGEFGHNDFYPVALAAAQMQQWDGRRLLKAMICLDEIRGRLAEVFALKNHKIDHVVHGAIASAAVYAAMQGGTEEQIESAIGMTVAHYIPFRAIRAGHQLSDSKGASAAISTEAAVLSARRALRGFVGPADIFRNPQAIFCLMEPPGQPDLSPFDLQLSGEGSDFAVMQMHFKLGLYEHQSAGAIQGLIDLLCANPALLDDVGQLEKIRIAIYEPAFSIIGDPAKRDPQTRQSADHSMVYIIAALLRKALQQKRAGWKELTLVPADYDDQTLFDPLTRDLMQRIEFVHGGPEYDARYPDGIPTRVELTHRTLGVLGSPLVMYPEGHARNQSGRLDEFVAHKFRTLAALGVDDVDALLARFSGLRDRSPAEIRDLCNFTIQQP